MASQIDPTIPVAGTPTTESVRNNFLTARNEISTLQTQTEGSPFLRLAGGRMTGAMYLAGDPTDAMMPATKGYVDASGGGGGGGGIPEAPAIGLIFGRGDGAWQQVVRTTGETMSGPLLLADDPDDPLGAATKQYVDAIADAIIGEAPDDSGVVFGRGDGEWFPVLPLTGGQLSGSIGTIAIPTSPAPFNVNVFSNAFNAVSGIRLNAYQSATNTYNYLVPNATMPAAALLHLSGSGAVALRVAQGGAAGDPITAGPAVTFDYKGNLMLGSAPVIPTDVNMPSVSAIEHVVGLTGHLSFNSYLATGGWKYLQSGYAGAIYQPSTNGNIEIITANVGSPGGVISFNPAFIFSTAGQFNAPANIIAGGLIQSSNGRVITANAGASPSFSVWEQASGYAAGMFIQGTVLMWGAMNAAGDAQNMLMTLDSSGNLGITGNLTLNAVTGGSALFSGSCNAGNSTIGGIVLSGGLGLFADINTSIGSIGGVAFPGSSQIHATGIGAIGGIDFVGNFTMYGPDNLAQCGVPGAAWFQVAAYNFPQQSDPRLKEALGPAPPDALGKVCAIPVHHFRYTKDTTRHTHTGFDASEVAPVFPDGVTVGDDDAKTQSVLLGDMLALLWQAVQELSEKAA